MPRMTKWYRANKKRPEIRKAYNARQRKWYKANIVVARENGRRNGAKYRKRHPRKFAQSAERARLKRGTRNRAYLEAYKREHSCVKCGEPDPVVLDFHHRNKRYKKFTISKWLWRASLKALDIEVAKCDVLCANCHRRLHYRGKR